MTHRLTAETFCFAPAQTLVILESLSRVRTKVVVGRRLHHRDSGVHSHRGVDPQGQGSPL